MEDFYDELCRVEAKMQDEVTSYSPSRVRFFRIVSKIPASQINTSLALKVLSIARQVELDSMHPDEANLEALDAWMAALLQANKGGLERLMFVDLEPEEPLASDLKNLKASDAAYIRTLHANRMKWTILFTLLCITVFAVVVMILDRPFKSALIWTIVFMTIGLWIILYPGRLRLHERYLRRMRHQAKNDIDQFLNRIPLRRITYRPGSLFDFLLLQMQRPGKRKRIKEKEQAKALAKQKAREEHARDVMSRQHGDGQDALRMDDFARLRTGSLEVGHKASKRTPEKDSQPLGDDEILESAAALLASAQSTAPAKPTVIRSLENMHLDDIVMDDDLFSDAGYNSNEPAPLMQTAAVAQTANGSSRNTGDSAEESSTPMVSQSAMQSSKTARRPSHRKAAPGRKTDTK